MSVKSFHAWSARRWLTVTLCMVVASFAIGGVMDFLTDSLWIHILVSVILSVLVMGAAIAWMRVLLRLAKPIVAEDLLGLVAKEGNRHVAEKGDSNAIPSPANDPDSGGRFARHGQLQSINDSSYRDT